MQQIRVENKVGTRSNSYENWDVKTFISLNAAKKHNGLNSTKGDQFPRTLEDRRAAVRRSGIERRAHTVNNSSVKLERRVSQRRVKHRR